MMISMAGVFIGNIREVNLSIAFDTDSHTAVDMMHACDNSQGVLVSVSLLQSSYLGTYLNRIDTPSSTVCVYCTRVGYAPG